MSPTSYQAAPPRVSASKLNLGVGRDKASYTLSSRGRAGLLRSAGRRAFAVTNHPLYLSQFRTDNALRPSPHAPLNALRSNRPSHTSRRAALLAASRRRLGAPHRALQAPRVRAEPRRPLLVRSLRRLLYRPDRP